MYLTNAGRMRGLVLLSSLALRRLTVLQWQLRRRLHESGEPWQGRSPGPQVGRSGQSRSCCWQRFGVSVGRGWVEPGHERRRLTALTSLQEQLRELWEFPADWYHQLTHLHFSQPPPVFSER